MIFYFSGSGNSYSVARQLANYIKGEQITSLVGFKNIKQCYDAERIGFVFPCYCCNAPDIVLEFKERLFRKISKDKFYVFAVITFANSAAGSYLAFKHDVDAWFEVQMPENDSYSKSVPTLQQQKILLAHAEIEVDEISKNISNKEKIIMYRPTLEKLVLSKFLSKSYKRKFQDFNKKLYADDNCTKCGQCVKFCPVQNITFDGSPVFGENCVYCFGCVNRCPKEAIQVEDKTRNQKRYINPDYVKVSY